MFIEFFPSEILMSLSILNLTLFTSTCMIFSFFFILLYPILTRPLCHNCFYILFLAILLTVQIFVFSGNCFNNFFNIENHSLLIKNLSILMTFFCLLIFAETVNTQKINNFEVLILVLSTLFGLLIITSTNDFLTLYLSIELQSLCLYTLAASKKDSSFSKESGVKYFLLGSVSSVLFLFGSCLFYSMSGVTNFDNIFLITEYFNAEFYYFTPQRDFYALTLALGFICFFYFFKLGAAPFHNWVPDVYEGSPTHVTVFFSVVPKFAIFTSFVTIIYSICGGYTDSFWFSDTSILFYSILFFSLLSLFLGTFKALKQKRFKRLLAFSSVSHVGLMLLSFLTFSFEGLSAMFLYLTVYSFMSLLLWSFEFSNSLKNNVSKKALGDFVNYSSYKPLAAFTVLCTLFSFMGMPPFIGFFSKLMIFLSLIYVQYYTVSVIVVFLSVISCFYYLRLVKILYFDKQKLNFFLNNINEPISYIFGFGFFALFFFFFNINPLFFLSSTIATSFF